MLILGKIATFFASKLGAYIILGALAAGIAGFAWYIWTDRESLQLELAAAEAANRQWEDAAERIRLAGERRVLAERANTEAVAATLERRNDDLASLADRLADIRAVEIPTDEAGCPVPAPIRRAVELLPDVPAD